MKEAPWLVIKPVRLKIHIQSCGLWSLGTFKTWPKGKGLEGHAVRKAVEGWVPEKWAGMDPNSLSRGRAGGQAQVLPLSCLAHTGTAPGSSAGKESACHAGDPGLIPWLGRSTAEVIGYPLQYSWASLVVQLVKNPPVMWETWVQSLGWEDPLENGKDTHSSMLAWRIPQTV